MNDLFIIASGAGLHDGLDPCLLTACSVFIVYRRWLFSNSLPVGWICFIFALAYAISTLVFNFGPIQVYVLQKNFIFAAKIIYFLLGACSFILGALSFKDWLSLYRGNPVEDLVQKKMKFFFAATVGVVLLTVILAVALGSLGTLWPIDKYIFLLGNAAILKGQWQPVSTLLVTYVIVSMWPLWFVWSFLCIKNLQASMRKIVCSAIFFTASTSMILIFK